LNVYVCLIVYTLLAAISSPYGMANFEASVEGIADDEKPGGSFINITSEPSNDKIGLFG
jgi:hypothetical protein